MSLQSAFNQFVKSLERHLAGYGFERRGGRVFRKYSPAGDVLIVELQTSTGSHKTERLFYINVALVLAPKWEWDRQRYKLPATELPRHLYGLWRHRIGFTGYSGGDRWRFTEANAAEVTEQVQRRLDESMPDMLRLLDRDQFMELAEQRGFLGAWSWWEVRAWLLAEHGPTEELEQYMNQLPADTRDSPPARMVWAYANSKAQSSNKGQ